MKKWIGAAVTAAALSIGGTDAVSAQGDASVTIVHGIPGITVDVQVDGEVVIAGFDAGDIQDLTPLAGQTLQDIVATRSGGDEVVIGPIESFTVPGEGNTSVVVHLDNSGRPTITPYLNAAPPTEQGRGLFTVRHVADAAPVAVTLDDEDVLSGIGNGQEGSVELPAGEITGAWITADGQRIAAVPTLLLEANTQLIVYVGGSREEENLEFYQQTIASDGTAESAPAPMTDGDDAAARAATDDDAESAPMTDGDDATARAATDDDAEAAADAEAAPEAASDDGEAAAQPADDGTPQPARVDTGGVSGPLDGEPVMLAAAGALVALAAAALFLRRRLMASTPVAAIGDTPWPPPTAER